MTISREKCLEMVREEDLDWQRGYCLSGETNRFEALINRAYQEGVRDTQRKMRGEMDNGGVDWRGCNEI